MNDLSDIDKASIALDAWFDSQGIPIPSRAPVAIKSIALSLLGKTHDPFKLAEGVALLNGLLVAEVANLLKALRKTP